VLNQASIEKLKLALSATSIAIWEWDILNDEVTWFSSHQVLPGLDSAIFQGSYASFLAQIHTDQRQEAANLMAEAIATQQKYHQDLQIVLPDHTSRWIALECQLICNPQGQAIQMIGTTLDITERKQAEIILQRQNERERLVILITQRLRRSLDLEEILNTTVAEVRAFLQADRAIVYRFQADWSSRVVVQSTAVPWLPIAEIAVRDSYLGKQYAQFYQQGGITAVANIHRAGLDAREIQNLISLKVQALLVLPISQGVRLWGLLVVHQCSYSRQWEPTDVNLLRKLANQLAVAVYQSELHQQVQQLNNTLEQQVQERTAQLQQALEFEAVLRRITDKVRDSLNEAQILNSVVQELATALQVDHCNAALYDLREKTSTIRYLSPPSAEPGERVFQMAEFPEIYQALLAGQILEYCPLPGAAMRPRVIKLACPILVRSTLAQEHKEVLGDLWLTRSGELAFDAQEVRLVQQVVNQCAIALRQARLYQAAQAQVQELERLNQLKDDFLSTVSHELRTPLSSIKTAIQLLESILKPLGLLEATSKAARYFQILQKESEREIHLINDLLDLTRLDAGTEPLMLSSVDLTHWVPYIVESFEKQSQRQPIQLCIAPNLPPVITDCSDLERILSELLQNACKYTPIDEAIIVTVNATEQAAQLSVCNTGVEIPAVEQERIFDKFYRIPNNDPWKHGGTGLGLALVKRLIEHIGATITVKSAQNHTCFTVEVALHPNAAILESAILERQEPGELR
jgi:signal transduction histidine kinase